MAVFSNSYLCQSANKTFGIVALENVSNLSFSCGNDNELAINLETQDYEALGFCQPPVSDQYYSIALRLPNNNSRKSGRCNSSHPYLGSTMTSKEIHCVDGSPLALPRNFDRNKRCNLASVLPGSLNQIYNATWTRCDSAQYVICQIERNASIFNFCKNVSSPTATRTTVTTSTATSTTPITALSNNSTAIIIGSVLGVLVILFLVLLLHLFHKRNKTKTNASKKRNHKVAVQK